MSNGFAFWNYVGWTEFHGAAGRQSGASYTAVLKWNDIHCLHRKPSLCLWRVTSTNCLSTEVTNCLIT